MNQFILDNKNIKKELESILKEKKVKKIFWVCTNSFRKQQMYLDIKEMLKTYRVIEFSNFSPNPQYESVCEAVDILKNENCDFILATGGGSAIDVAKCVKLFSGMDSDCNYLEQVVKENTAPILAIPTTAGTGSEATKFAVIYYCGNKQSISHESCIPEYVILEPNLLNTLPEYQKKATMFDALCHAIESMWSINSTEESKEYAKEAISLIVKYKNEYLRNSEEGNKQLLQAAYLAGKAINITQTTAGHAMSYKLTGLYGISHGHAVALCVASLWPYMLQYIHKCIDKRGKEYLQNTFEEIAKAMGYLSAEDAIRKLAHMIQEYELETPEITNVEELDYLCKSVNVERLKNNPVELSEDDIREIYKKILKVGEK